MSSQDPSPSAPSAPISASTPRKRRKVTRSRAGCLTCRRRRKLCDHAKPTCGACIRLSVDCTWPDVLRDRPSASGSAPGAAISESTAAVWMDAPRPLAPLQPPLTIDFVGAAAGSAPAFDWPDLFGAEFEIDDAMLQAWAAGCMTLPSAALDPSALFAPLPLPPSTSTPTRPSSTDTALLAYFSDTLSSLVSVNEPDTPSAFQAFTRLAEIQTSPSPEAQALHMSIMAWAGIHAVRNGQPRFEITSERLGEQATALVTSRLLMGYGETERERLTLLAAMIMIAQYKICRGDVSGYAWMLDHLRKLGQLLYRLDGPDIPPDSMAFHFFENLVYHDVLSSTITLSGPIVQQEVVSRHAAVAPDSLHSLTGVSLPLFSKMHRVAGLHRFRRQLGPLDKWTDDQLLDLVKAAEEIEKELKEERSRLDAVLSAKPHLKNHQYLHAAFRTSCLLALRALVLCEPPTAVALRLLVRQTLSLLETMCDQSLPGWCSSHWIMFITGLCACDDGEDGDRARVLRLYEEAEEMGFGNFPRSLKVVREVWARGGGVDWLDVIQEWEWEMFLV